MRRTEHDGPLDLGGMPVAWDWRALCARPLHGFRAAGGERAVVKARGDTDYPAPRLVYESLGFRQFTRTRWYRQPA